MKAVREEGSDPIMVGLCFNRAVEVKDRSDVDDGWLNGIPFGDDPTRQERNVLMVIENGVEERE